MEPSVRAAGKTSLGSAISRAATLLVWLILSVVLVKIAIDNTSYQWDFRVFYSAPATLETGVNPYDKSDSTTGIPETLSYLYPPVILYVFRPFAALSFPDAYLAWFALKLVALSGLLVLWHRNFEPLSASWPIVLFCALGFNAAILRDLTAGNISIFEELGLWLGFYFFVRRKPYIAGLCIAVVAQFKLLPIAFLGLLLVGSPRGWKPFLTSLAVFCVLLSLNGLILPDLTRQYVESFWSRNPNLDERGVLNPSSLAVIRDLTERTIRAGVELPPLFAEVSYLLLVSALGAMVLWGLWKYSAELKAQDPRWVVYIACVLFVLTMPRVKDYTYIILLMPTLFVLRRVKPQYLVPLLGVLVFIPPTETYVPMLNALRWMHGYGPWLAAWFLLFLLIESMRNELPAKLDRVKPTFSQ